MQHGSGSGLAVSAGDDEHFPAAQEFVMQQLWSEQNRIRWSGRVRAQCYRAKSLCPLPPDRGLIRELRAFKRLSDGDP